jgi:hypothetical protein
MKPTAPGVPTSPASVSQKRSKGGRQTSTQQVAVLRDVVARQACDVGIDQTFAGVALTVLLRSLLRQGRRDAAVRLLTAARLQCETT